ncbi:hypothetical protein Nepgr_005845 [Nepenthes gracilis]|uniref:Inactive receptor kinase At5g67200 n=1 Tax=Nepenthes gracilis TaxID=150966 RepID=A0AAD3XGZ2_NEPGR|nr:hypothetical protein Nepgr_005845 [Nepenthes gracilis]
MLKRNYSLQFFLVLSLSALSFTSVFSSSPIPSDALALLDFKSKADLHNTLPFTSNTTSSFCKWRGVGCSEGRVVRLVLESLSLAGVFSPNSLTRLDQLRVLSLRNNSLSGRIPDLSTLVNAKALFLDHNSFNDSFPESISTLHRLRTVDLSHNNLTGQLPTWLTRLDRLYYLKLEFNRFTGTIPPLNQSTLSIFNVSGNNLSGPIPVTPALSKFGPSSYALNLGLCGEIVHRECFPKIPFLGLPAAAAPESEAPRPQPLGLGQYEQIQGSIAVTQRRHKTSAVIWGFSAGAFVLIGSLLCFVFAMKQRRNQNQAATQPMASDSVATADAAEVMRTEEEREEKLKRVQQGMKVAANSGSLVFCAGEAQLYTLEQLMRASAEMLGRGIMGATYKAVLDNRLIVCVKRLDASKIGSAGKEGFVRHMESVGALRHPNLVPLRAYFQAKEERLLVYDYQPNGSLFSLIHGTKSARAKPLHWTSCLKIAEDVAQGLSYVHQAWRLVHGNLKSSNVLLGSDFEACITDYGLAALADSSSLDDPNSLGYKAPEIRKSSHHIPTSKSDVYAFGVLLLELLTGKLPSQHPHLSPKDIVKWVRATRDVDDHEEENRLAMLLEVALACSMTSPEKRPTMWQVLKMLQEVKEAVVLEDTEIDPLARMS